MIAIRNEPTSALAYREIRKSFGEKCVLDNITLDIVRGELFVLLGPSGSGKSTLLKIASGIEKADSGRVWIGGNEVTEIPPHRRRVHTVFQNYALFPHLDVARNIEFPLSITRTPIAERQQRIKKVLELVGLQTFETRNVNNLSGGEKQRVALARALVGEPDCLLLDEPLSALDPYLRGQTLEMLQQIQTELNTTYLYITHDREEALRIGYRIAILNNGKLEQIGTPEEIYHQPKTAFVAGFIGPISWIPGITMKDGQNATLLVPNGGEIPISKNAKESTLTIGVRPEHVTISNNGFLRGTLVSRQFAGSFVMVRVLLKGGSHVLACLPGDQVCPAVGESVGVSWRPEKAHLFQESVAIT